MTTDYCIQKGIECDNYINGVCILTKHKAVNGYELTARDIEDVENCKSYSIERSGIF